MRSPFTDAATLASMVHDGATIAVAGSGGGLIEPDAVLEAIEARFLAEGHPRDLTVVHALGIGARGERGISRLAHEGMVRRVIGGHWTWSPQMQALARNEKIEAYTLPGGAIMLLMREIGGGRPGLVTHVGLGTFADPRHGGGAANGRARQAGPLTEIIELDGREWLRYRPFPIDFGILRGSAADEAGNLTTREEAADIDIKGVALAAHNSGGKVLAQVRQRVPRGSLHARSIELPGILVDAVILAPDQRQTHHHTFDPGLAGEPRRDDSDTPHEPLPRGLRAIIASRAADELFEGASVNFGFGIPGGIPPILRERGTLDDIWITVEQGMHNGDLLDGDLFGASRHPDAIISSLEQFDFYSGGGIDAAFLGMAELDAIGDVNVSRLGGNIVGPGGFVDITQNARKVVFCGTFEAKGLVANAREGRLVIERPGEVGKLVERVAEITFSASTARQRGQEVIYVTERAVFRLGAEGIELVEVAPGIDTERDVLQRMAFKPVLRDTPKAIDRRHLEMGER
ncbi:MAG: CoA-transferase [Geminicoccaceae bacterium]